MHIALYLKKFCAALTLGIALAAAAGCVHRIPIQQGNFLDAKDIDRVEVGMTRVQVRALLGTPMIADPFNESRWDYLFYFKAKQLDEPIRRHFIVHFDEQDKVARIERIGTPTPDAEAAEDAAVEEVEKEVAQPS